MFKKIILLVIPFIILLLSCEEKNSNPNDPNDPKHIAGSWEIIKSEIVYKDSTVTIPSPLLFRIFDINGTFEQIKLDDFGVPAYTKNQWTATSGKMILNFAQGSTENWNFTIGTDQIIFEREGTENGLPVTYRNEYTPRSFVVNETYIGSFDLIRTTEFDDTDFKEETPEDTGINESLSLNQDGSFINNINNNGSVSSETGTWGMNYYLIIQKYDAGNVSVLQFEPTDEGIALTKMYHDNTRGLVTIFKEFKKK